MAPVETKNDARRRDDLLRVLYFLVGICGCGESVFVLFFIFWGVWGFWILRVFTLPFSIAMLNDQEGRWRIYGEGED